MDVQVRVKCKTRLACTVSLSLFCPCYRLSSSQRSLCAFRGILGSGTQLFVIAQLPLSIVTLT